MLTKGYLPTPLEVSFGTRVGTDPLRTPAAAVETRSVPSLSQAPSEGPGIPSEFSLYFECGKGTAPACVHSSLAAFTEVLRHYSETLRLPLWFHEGASRYRKPLAGGALYLHHFALPTPPVLLGFWSRIPLRRLPFAFGHPLSPSTQQAFAAGSQLGRGRILHDPEGWPVIELAGCNIYILFNLLGQEDELRTLLFRRLLDLGLPHLFKELSTLSPLRGDHLQTAFEHLRRETEALEAAWRRERQAQVRQAYLQECQGRVQEEIAFLEREINCIEDNLEEYARRITTETRRLQECRQRLNALRGIRTTDREPLREIDELRQLPEVRDLQVQDGRITIVTTPLQVEYGGRWFQLGSFRIELGFGGEIRMRNLTDAVGAYDHPHIYQGRPCLGNIREGVAKMIGEYQLVAAVYVLLDFLKTVNPRDWRIPVVYWREVAS